RLIAEGPRLNARSHSHRNMTILHGDAHVWNLFLPRDPASDDVRLFDWDAWRVDVATDDLAYMMALHWFPDRRRRHERALLDRYHAELVAHGVTATTGARSTTIIVSRPCGRSRYRCGRRSTTSRRRCGGRISSASSWRSRISAALNCLPDKKAHRRRN